MYHTVFDTNKIGLVEKPSCRSHAIPHNMCLLLCLLVVMKDAALRVWHAQYCSWYKWAIMCVVSYVSLHLCCTSHLGFTLSRTRHMCAASQSIMAADLPYTALNCSGREAGCICMSHQCNNSVTTVCNNSVVSSQQVSPQHNNVEQPASPLIVHSVVEISLLQQM